MLELTDAQIDQIEAAPVDTRRRWYAEMNAWQWPADFPVPNVGVPDRARNYSGSDYQIVMDALRQTLTEQDQSWGWWKYNIGKTFEEWASWWGTMKRSKVTITDTPQSPERLLTGRVDRG